MDSVSAAAAAGSDSAVCTRAASSDAISCAKPTAGLAAWVARTLADRRNSADTKIPAQAGTRLKLKMARIRSSTLLFAKLLHSGAGFGVRCAMSRRVSA